MVTVHIWEQSSFFDRHVGASHSASQLEFARSVGHVSISFDYNGYEYYESFWPDRDCKAIELANPFEHFHSKFNSYKDDVRDMGSTKDYDITLYNLNNDNIADFLSNLNSSWKYYNLYTKNCSTLALGILKAGATNLRPSYWSSAKDFFNKSLEVINAFGWAFPETNAGQRQLAMNIAAHDSDPFAAISYVFKNFGGDTPEAVVTYARFLETEVG